MLKNVWLFALCSLVMCACGNRQQFKKLTEKQSGISFNNLVAENDSINILDLEYVYNGGGVAIADFNNDGLQDVFFTGNLVSNRLYINEGNMHFRDASATANIDQQGKWCTGVAAVDINNDGLMDVYACASIKNNPAQRENLLLINQGNDANGNPRFTEQARQYNVADTGHTTNAAFFDYDNDGDLDLYLLTNQMVDNRYPNKYHPKVTDGTSPNTDRLYRNDWDSAANHPVFTNVSTQAGILTEGFGLGVNITDINKDGWKDIYVTNDYLTNDLLWINNRNGTFTNRSAEYFKHTSYSAMGNDVADINNDGLVDVIAVDMLPRTNERKKMMMSANNYQTNLNNDQFKYEYQYGRNTLQLNQGFAPAGHDSVPHPHFSDIGFFAGIAETDWSWTPLVTDFDNDGFRDIVITNGFPKDITDHDFMVFRANASNIASKDMILEQIPEVKLKNFAFKNNGDLTFSDVTTNWGLGDPTFSSGAAYGDLDNDGDMDMVISNINMTAEVYENTAAHGNDDPHYLQVVFEGDAHNRGGIGAWAEVYYDGNKKQVYENTPYRGYISSVQNMAHFGLGATATIDSLVVKWPNGKCQVFANLPASQRVVAAAANANSTYSWQQPANTPPLFTLAPNLLAAPYLHPETDFADFSIQKLLPHKLSEYGPALAVGDLDGNGLDDVVAGGSYGHSAILWMQQAGGTFVHKALIPGANNVSKPREDMGVLVFDADGDGDQDIYIASGSYESQPGSHAYTDYLYLNNGKGGFTADTTAMPLNRTSKSCVRAADFDKDGDLDLLIAGRVNPWNYPQPVSSFIYRNDSKNGQARFTDVTATVAPMLKDIGLTCDAVWTDFNNDGYIDLLLAGEWMPLTFLQNNKGTFSNVTAATGTSGKTGLFTSIMPGDFDNDGDMDYVVGNMGLNSFYRANEQHPTAIYAKDFDGNGNLDAVPTLYLEDNDGRRREYPAQTRDDIVKQMISFRSRFQNYKSFATATLPQVLQQTDLQGALVRKANTFATSLYTNNGDGTFKVSLLPAQAQLSTINGMVADDFDDDGNLDLVLNGNDFGTEVSVGRYDALNGLLLKGDGKGGFEALPMAASGICIPGNGKALVKVMGHNGQYHLFASQNRGLTRVFSLANAGRLLAVQANDESALIAHKNGQQQRVELQHGASFLSQQGRFIRAGRQVSSVTITNTKGQRRQLTL